jgi:hypothetical protein
LKNFHHARVKEKILDTLYLSFGCNYGHGSSWVRIVAPNEKTARRAAFDHFGGKWAFLRSEADFDPAFFPKGELFAFETDENLSYRKLP